MKVKYYLRGLGIGIMVTAFVLSLKQNDGKLSDEEIISRASALGMVMKEDSIFTEDEDDGEEQKTTDNSGEIENNGKDNSDAAIDKDVADNNTEREAEEAGTGNEAADQSEDTVNVEGAENTAENGNTENTDTAGNGENTESTENPTEQGKEYQLGITEGMSSDRVSYLLGVNGMVDDSAAFNRYLMDNGFSRRIRVGEFTINSAMSYEEIAKVITGR